MPWVKQRVLTLSAPVSLTSSLSLPAHASFSTSTLIFLLWVFTDPLPCSPFKNTSSASWCFGTREEEQPCWQVGAHSCASSEVCKGQDISAVQTFLLLGAWAMAHPYTTSLMHSSYLG